MKVLNFGSLNLDYVYDVPHFVRAGETLASTRLSTFCGGKGLNQSIAFARAGAQTVHAGNVGKEGGMLLDALREAGVQTSLVSVHDDVASGHAIIQNNADGENCILLYGGANMCVSEEQIDRVLADFGKGDLLMLQNEINCLPAIVSRAHERGMTVVLNPSPFNERIYELDMTCVDYLIVNETEGEAISGKSEPDAIIETLLSTYPDMHVVLTLGKNGACYADKDGRAFHPILPAAVVDTTAAGDTFTGYFFCELMQGSTPYEALRMASAASSLAVSRKGASVSIPCREDVCAMLSTYTDKE